VSSTAEERSLLFYCLHLFMLYFVKFVRFFCLKLCMRDKVGLLSNDQLLRFKVEES
jgi:hypothetical protein